MKTTLTDRQERFVYEYLLDQNASAAAQRAGYSARTKGTQAAEVMKNPLVKARIVRELADLYARLRLNALDMLKGQIAAAYFDPAKLFDANQDPVPLDQLDADTKAALTISYDRRKSGEHVLRVRQTPRHVALSALWKRFEAFEKMRAEVEAREEAFIAARQREEMAQETHATPGRTAAHRAPVLDLERLAAPSAMQAMSTQPTSMPMAQADAEIAQAARSIAVASAGVAPVDAASARSADASFIAPVDLAPAPASATAAAPSTAPVNGDDAPNAANSKTADDYDFRKDPNWMWGGRQKPTPEPEPNPLVLQAMADAQWREQNAALHAAHMNRHMKVRPGAIVAPTPMEPGYNPPWLRDPSRGARPRFAEGAGEFEWSWGGGGSVPARGLVMGLSGRTAHFDRLNANEGWRGRGVSLWRDVAWHCTLARQRVPARDSARCVRNGRARIR